MNLLSASSFSFGGTKICRLQALSVWEGLKFVVWKRVKWPQPVLCTYSCFPGVLLTSTLYDIRSNLLSHRNIVLTMDSGERGMNPVSLTIINLCKKYWLSWQLNQRPPFLKSCTLPTELLGSTLLNPFPNKPWFSHVCSSTSLSKTLWEKEKLLATSNLSFSHSVFYPFGKLSTIFINFEIVVCKLFQFGRL